MTDEERAEEYVSRLCGKFDYEWNNSDMEQAYLDGLAEGRKEICNKILKAMKHTSDERYIRNESFPFNFEKRDIEQIIYCLGVEL